MKLDLSPRPPRVRRDDDSADPYRWMRDDTRKLPEVIDHLKAENDYTDAVISPIRPCVDALFEEMVARIKEDDETAPVRWGGFLYSSRTETGKQYRIFCRRPEGGAEQVYLDANREAEGYDYYRLGALAISPDHRLLAWAADTDGGETYTIRVRDLASGENLEDTIEGAYAGLEWAADNRTLFYTTLDKTHRPWRLHRHVLGTPATDDVLVFEEPDESFFLNIHKTRSQRFLVIHLGSNDTNEAHYLAADDPFGEFRILAPRKKGVEYSIDHHGESFLIHSNEDAVNFRLFEAPVGKPSRDHWTEVIPHRPDVQLERVEPFCDHLAVIERRAGVTRLRIFSMPGYQAHDVEFDEPAYCLTFNVNPEYDSGTVRFVYESLTTPETVIDYDMTARTRAVRKVEEVLGGYDPGEYVADRIHATAPDGTRVPVSLVHRRGIKLDGDNPLLLYAYGAYGMSTDPGFHSIRISLLDRGFVYAIAHVRGGADLGRPWYDAGKLEHKTNTFTDFIACAEHLVAEGYTSRERLAIRGGSAGGLLVGAVLNMRPDLFGAAIAKVPFVDVMNTMLDADLPLTVIEYDEWGNPNEKAAHDRMRAYSPYDNVRAQAYPDMLVTAGLNDPRVAYWEPAKWVARIREMQTGEGVVLLKTELGAGHGGPSGRYDSIREIALEYGFLLDRIGTGSGSTRVSTGSDGW
jgi:oligopeptidase B